MSVQFTHVFHSNAIAMISPRNGSVTPRRFATLCARLTAER
jgi:hypothetical protein